MIAALNQKKVTERDKVPVPKKRTTDCNDSSTAINTNYSSK